MYGPLNLQAAVDRILATLANDTPTLATVNTNVVALGSSTRLGNIKGVDRGTITCATTSFGTANGTIGSVTLSRSIATFGHANGISYLSAAGEFVIPVSASGHLSNSTTVVATSGSRSSGRDTEVAGRLRYEVVEVNT